MEKGIFLRGILVGTRVVNRNYTNAQGQPQTSTFTEIGIEDEYTNSFGRVQKITRSVRISAEKEKDAAFMKSLNDNHLALIEIPINVGDFKSLYVDSSATIEILETSSKVA
jgi:hypothetical protein